MDVEIRQNPAFAIARLKLAGNETARVQAGAMAATSHGVGIQAQMQGGMMKSLKRSMLGGESLFITTLTAPGEGGWADVASSLPGDAATVQLDGSRKFCLTRGSYIASASTIEIDTKWGGFKNLAGGEGGFFLHCSGTGPLVMACYGALETYNLGAGERLVVDTGHLVGWDDGVEYITRRASGTMASIKSAEGLVFEFTGPGRVFYQTRNPSALVTWLVERLPTNN